MQLTTIQVQLATAVSAVQSAESDTEEFKSKTKELIEKTFNLKNEFLANAKALAALRHALRRSKDNMDLMQTLVSQFLVFENSQREFEEKMLRPCECEEGLFAECCALERRWEEAFEQVKGLLQKVQQLQIEQSALNHLTAPQTKEKQAQTLFLDAIVEIEVTVLYLCATCQKKFQQLKQVADKLRCGKDVKGAVLVTITESENLRKQAEAMQKAPEVQEAFEEEVVEEVVNIDDLQEVMVAAEAQEEEVIVHPRRLLGTFPFTDALEDLTGLSEGAPLNRTSELDPLTESSERREAKLTSRSEYGRISDFTSDRSFFRDTIRKAPMYTWTSADSEEEGSGGSFSPFEAFALFNTAVKEAEEGDTPRQCVRRYLERQFRERADETWSDWLASVRSYWLEDLVYAKVILASLQLGVDYLPTCAARAAVRLIQACGRLTEAVETDTAADSASFGEVTISQEFEKMLDSGGLMYWTDCIDLVYSALTPQAGTKVLQRLRPSCVTRSEYVTFQICHKMHAEHLDGIKIFKLLDRNRSGKLDAAEFSRGLSDLLRLWIAETDISHTFLRLHNRWSGLVSKAQFSRQVNFTEYLQKCKGDLAHLSKYTFLSAFTEACQDLVREALALLNAAYENAEEEKELPLDLVSRCFQVATEAEDVTENLEAWQNLLIERFQSESPHLSFTEAMQVFIDTLCS